MDTSMTDDSQQMTTCGCRDVSHERRHGHCKSIFQNENYLKIRLNFRKRTLETFFIVVCVILSQNHTFGFNLDVNFPTFVTIPEKKSYFGFSVDMYAGDDDSWLLVGAPKSKSRGEVYMCRYEENVQHNCTRIEITKDDSATSRVKDMFGATLKTGLVGKELLICAPYFTQQTTVQRSGNSYETYYDMIGVCYFMDNFMEAETNVFKLIPCQGDKGDHHDGDDHGSCEIGMSAAFTKDGHYLILGATGSYYRQGSIMRLVLPIKNEISNTKLPVHTGELKPDAPPDWKWKHDLYVQMSVDENYFGYAVATGKSLGDSQLVFVGAPRRFGYDLLGMVEIYDEFIDTLLFNISGNQTGEYFGSALASADLNNDGLDDLVVGAPLYSDSKRKLFESGRIYVYYQLSAAKDKENFLKLNFSEPVVIYGTKGRSRFGNTITAIGDINQDGYDDIAVSAPYAVNDGNSEQSDGSVFIFNGGPEGLVIPASQEIQGLKLDNSLTAFGYSIAGEKDVDRNGYPDVIVGAYLSDQAVLLRSRPVIEITSKVSTDPQVVDIEIPSCAVDSSTTSCFKIRTCFSYTGKSVPASVQLSYTYDIDSGKTGDDKRAFILDETPKNITLVRKSSRNSETLCVEMFAYFKIDIRDKLSEIIVKVSPSLIDRNEPVEPVLNQLKPTYASNKVSIFKDCGEDDICQADLKVQSALDTGVAYVGKAWPIVLEEAVQNLGEPAFLSTLVVEFPKEVSYVGTQDKTSTTGVAPLCSNAGQFVTCEIGNPMKRDAKVNVNLKFQTIMLNGNYSSLTFKSFVNSTNPTNNTSETRAAALSISVKSEIIIYNTSSPDIIYLKDSDRDDKSNLDGNLTSVIHTYEINNKGPSDFSAGTIQLRWPLKSRNGLNLLELVQILEDQKTISCGAVDTTHMDEVQEGSNMTDTANYHFCDGRAQCASVTCEVNGPLNEATIIAQFKLPLSTVLQNDMNSFIRSELSFKIDKYPYSISPDGGPMTVSEITTKCLYDRKPEPKKVQWWIIAIAVGAGLLFLLLLIFLLWRCGFFERKKKPESSDDRDQKEQLNPNGGVDDDAEEMEQYLK